ncbi:MAG: NAD(P)/FAD-dependent oxidoreductase [Lachnospiraceae bacterium]|nr:NAD(P)/FAD-dependent oxidoreductase [Lachnospiraceae bacterium]
MSKIIVVGGGPAGMMAAYAAASNGAEVVLLEKNEKLGKKLFITGKGRCNVTNYCDLEQLFRNILTNPKFLNSSIRQFTNQDVYDFFNDRGCALKVERGDRVFPESDHSSDVIRTMEKALKELQVKILLNTGVKEILVKDEKAYGVKLEDNTELEGDSVILAMGGKSYVSTGSDGYGFTLAHRLGHHVVTPQPGLVPLEVREGWVKDLQGLSLRNVELKLINHNGKVVYKELGEMLFTHFGVSGPLILSASSYLKEKEGPYILRINLKPGLSEDMLDARLLRDFEENNHKEFKNALGKLFPTKLIPVMVELSGIPGEQKVYDITRTQRLHFLKQIMELTMTVTGTRGFQEAIITRGGVDVKEINPSTMESRRVRDLYFAGEMLDCDALTGGFNLQIAWSTGNLAGTKAEQKSWESE